MDVRLHLNALIDSRTIGSSGGIGAPRSGNQIIRAAAGAAALWLPLHANFYFLLLLCVIITHHHASPATSVHGARCGSSLVLQESGYIWVCVCSRGAYVLGEYSG